MNKSNGGGSVSSEGGIRVSGDPILDAPGLMECGDVYVPSPHTWGERSVPEDQKGTDPGTMMGHQALYDDDDLGGPNTVTSR